MRVPRVYPAYSPTHPPIFREKSKVFKPHQASSALINPRHFFRYVVTAELVQSDFYFQTPTAHAVRPRFWASRVQENQGKSMRFVFEK